MKGKEENKVIEKREFIPKGGESVSELIGLTIKILQYLHSLPEDVGSELLVDAGVINAWHDVVEKGRISKFWQDSERHEKILDRLKNAAIGETNGSNKSKTMKDIVDDLKEIFAEVYNAPAKKVRQ